MTFVDETSEYDLTLRIYLDKACNTDLCISTLLATVPTYQISKGEKKWDGRIAKRDIWYIESEAPNMQSVQHHWRNLEKKLNKETLYKIRQNSIEVSISIIISFRDYVPGIIFPKYMIRFVNDFEAILEVDIR